MTAVKPSDDAYPYEDRDSPPPSSCGGTHAFINIFACRACRKQSRPRAAEQNHSNNVAHAQNLLMVNGVLVNRQQQSQRRLDSVPEEGSLRRPLTCRSLGKIIRKREPKVPTTVQESSQEDNASLGSQWKSLPNLRSPSIAVRAMTNKFLALTRGSDCDQEKKAKKRARFQETVDVVVHDEEGNPILMDVVALKDEEEQELLGFDNMAAAGMSSESGPDSFENPRDKQALRMECMDITRSAEGHKYLKCVIHISEEFDKRRVTIRATSGGTKLVLVAFRSEPLGDGTNYWHQHIQKFRLPHAINPHEVNAVLHSGGDLVIQAPLFEFEGNT